MCRPTALRPSGGGWWRDTVGFFSATDWTPSNDLVNFDDVVAAIKTLQGGVVVRRRPSPPGNVAHLSVPDVEPGNINTIVNLADVMRRGMASGHEMYPIGPADADGNCP